MLRILVVDDDETLRMTVRAALESRGYTVREAENGEVAVEIFQAEGPFDAALLDVNMPQMNGLEALARIKELNPATFCLMMTAYSDVKDAVFAIKNGAYDYVEKPVTSCSILRLVDEAIEANELVQAAAFSAPNLDLEDGRKMIGGSIEIRKVFELIYKLSKVDTAVLIRGESGTGKELVARAIHFNSHRKRGPFVAVNCAAIPDNLIESELFGYEKGAFTGADRRKIGKFQFAEGGTLFLDEIGDVSPQTQVKLLRALQEKRICPVGANQEQPVDVRIVAATNRPLEKMIETGAFRADLFYRLNVLPLNLPALRERREDVLPLVRFMIKKFNRVHQRRIKDVDRDTMGALKLYGWPGNIRELENVIEHAFILEGSDRLTLSSLPDHIRALAPQQGPEPRAGDGDGDASEDGRVVVGGVIPASLEGATRAEESDLNFPALKEKFEKEFILKALKVFEGRINQTAEHTQMTKVTLLRKLEKYGIDPRQFHPPRVPR